MSKISDSRLKKEYTKRTSYKKGGEYTMRLFLAIHFSDPVKNQILDIMRILKLSVRKGRFVPLDHLHLTLEFLGDIEEPKTKEIIDVLNEIDCPSFTLQLSDIGYFNTRKGRLYWLAPEPNTTLMHLQSEIHQKLLERGFTLNTRAFFPHITIARNIKLKEQINRYSIDKRLKQIQTTVRSVALMESKTVDGKLTYTVLASKELL